MATRPVVLRLSAEGDKRVKAALRDLGAEGQRGLKRIERAGKPASRSLRLVNAASVETTRSLDQLANRAGPLAGIARSLGPIGLALGAAAGGTALLAVQARRAASEVAAIGDAADRAGVAVDTFEQLRAALIQVGQPTGSLESALSALNRRIGEARAGAGQAAQVFETLDIQLTDVDGPRSFEAVLADIADRFEDLDASQRLALGQKLGEETFRSLVPVLEQGSEGLRQMAEEAERTGLLFGGELIRSAQDLNIAFERQSTIVGVQMKTAFLQAGPAVVALSENVAAAAPLVVAFSNEVAEAIARLSQLLGFADLPLGTRLRDAQEELRDIQQRLADMDAQGLGRGGGAASAIRESNEARERELIAEIERLQLRRAEQERLAERLNEATTFTSPEVNLGAAAAQTQPFQQAMAQIGEQIAQQELARREIGLTAGEVARLRAELQLTAAAQEQFGVVTEEVAVLIGVMANEIGKQIAATNQAVEAEKRWEEAAKRRAQAQEEAARVMTQAIERTADTLANMVTNSENLLRRLLALMLQTFAGSGPLGPLVNKKLGVSGGGLISSIFGVASTAIPTLLGAPNLGLGGSFAFGSEPEGFRVPGSGGVDSQLMTMRVTPGERVRVESQPRREGEGGGAVSVSLNYTINSDNPAFVEEVLERNRPRFIKDARDATLTSLFKAKRGARGTFGRSI